MPLPTPRTTRFRFQADDEEDLSISLAAASHSAFSLNLAFARGFVYGARGRRAELTFELPEHRCASAVRIFARRRLCISLREAVDLEVRSWFVEVAVAICKLVFQFVTVLYGISWVLSDREGKVNRD